MKAFTVLVFVLIWASAFLFCSSVRGDNVCGSNKSGENQVVLDKENQTDIINTYNKTGMTCAWQITAPPGYRVVLWGSFCRSETFKTFNTKVYDGTSSSDLLLWDSSWTKPEFRSFDLYSSNDSARVVLVTGNGTDNSSCFLFSAYAVSKQDCTNDQVFNINSSSVGNFTSPYYPYGYPANVSCGWKIKAPPGKLVMLQIVKSRTECSSLNVYNGENDKPENLLWPKSCLDVIMTPVVLFSYGQSLLVKFNSVSKYPRNPYFMGFLAQYSAIDPGYMCAKGSGGINSTYGTISTPGFPSNVSAKAMTCVWSLSAPVGHVVRLDLDTINLHHKTFNCPKISIKNFNGFVLKKFDCHDFLSKTLVFDEKRLQIEYKKPEYKPVKPVGIIGKYAVIPLEATGSCGGNLVGTITLKGEAATFHSLNYPNKHPSSMNCTWNITVTPGQVVELGIDTSLGSDCDKNWIQIYDGPTKSSHVLTKLCRNHYSKDNPKLYSSSNQLLVELIGKTPSKGFTATYVARKAAPKSYACSTFSETHYSGMEGRLASWGFPLLYPNNAHCKWSLEVPARYIVKFTVLSLDLQPDASCHKDFLKVLSKEYDSNKNDYKYGKLAKLCGKNGTLLSFRSTTSQMMVEFKSDAAGRFPGFEAMFEAEPISKSSGGNEKTKLLIAIFSALGAIALIVLIVCIIKYRQCSCPNQSKRDFNMLALNEGDEKTLSS